MAEYRDRQKLSDDDVRAILTSCETYKAIATALNIGVRTVQYYRSRESKRALRIARDLGLPPLHLKPLYVPDEQGERAYVVNGARPNALGDS